MCLLQVLTISKGDLTDGEVAALSQCSALVIKGITQLLLQTMRMPNPGHAIVSNPIHHPRHMPSQFFLSDRGQQLASIQHLIHQRLIGKEYSGFVNSGLQSQLLVPNDSSVNLEKCHAANIGAPFNRKVVAHNESKSHHRHGYCSYGLGQISIDYILNGIKDNSFKDRQPSEMNLTLSSDMKQTEQYQEMRKSLALSYLIREKSLSNTGLDLTVRSCLHLLIQTLYSQWLVPSFLR